MCPEGISENANIRSHNKENIVENKTEKGQLHSYSVTKKSDKTITTTSPDKTTETTSKVKMLKNVFEAKEQSISEKKPSLQKKINPDSDVKKLIGFFEKNQPNTETKHSQLEKFESSKNVRELVSLIQKEMPNDQEVIEAFLGVANDPAFDNLKTILNQLDSGDINPPELYYAKPNVEDLINALKGTNKGNIKDVIKMILPLLDNENIIKPTMRNAIPLVNSLNQIGVSPTELKDTIVTLVSTLRTEEKILEFYHIPNLLNNAVKDKNLPDDLKVIEKLMKENEGNTDEFVIFSRREHKNLSNSYTVRKFQDGSFKIYRHYHRNINDEKAEFRDKQGFLGDGKVKIVYRLEDVTPNIAQDKRVDIVRAILNEGEVIEPELEEFITSAEKGTTDYVLMPLIVEWTSKKTGKKKCELIMERMDMDALKFVENENTPDVNVRLNLLLDAARGVEVMHKQGRVHRDIKAQNIMTNKDGKSRLADLDSIAKSGTSVKPFGTANNAAPEAKQLDESGLVTATKPADIYSLGRTIEEIFPEIFYKNDNELSPKERAIKDLAINMTEEDPSGRPEIKSVIEDIIAILAK